MKIIESSVEILDIPDIKRANDIDIDKFLEKIGRTCYKSEDKITDDSCIKFVKNLIKYNHTSVLEHFIYVARITRQDYYNIINKYDHNNPYYKFINLTKYIKSPNQPLSEQSFLLSYSIASKLNLKKTENDSLYRFLKDLEWKSTGTEKIYLTQDEIVNLPIVERMRHMHITVKFICDRGIMAELTRHRQASFSVESTRYANYSLDKFGNEITIISPFENNNDDNYSIWKHACEDAEYYYMKLLRSGVAPQIARSVLPNSLKTEVVMTAPLWSWIHFFNLRMSKSAHPQMRELVKRLYNKIQAHDKYKSIVKLLPNID